MRTRNCPECYGKGTIRLGHRHPKCGFCHGRGKITSEFFKWEESRIKFRVETMDSLAAIVELKFETAIKKWLEENKKPRKFPKQKGDKV